MNYLEAKEKYKSQFFGVNQKGKRCVIECVFPFGNFYKDDTFININMPLKLLNMKSTFPHLVTEYTKGYKTKRSEMEPIWISVGRRLKNGDIIPKWNFKISILDGNHRAIASKKARHKVISVIIPQSHYDYYTKNKEVWA